VRGLVWEDSSRTGARAASRDAWTIWNATNRFRARAAAVPDVSRGFRSPTPKGTNVTRVAPSETRQATTTSARARLKTIVFHSLWSACPSTATDAISGCSALGSRSQPFGRRELCPTGRSIEEIVECQVRVVCVDEALKIEVRNRRPKRAPGCCGLQKSRAGEAAVLLTIVDAFRTVLVLHDEALEQRTCRDEAPLGIPIFRPNGAISPILPTVFRRFALVAP
jgi:hypothetical protein